MTDPVAQLARALLYEGYLLYPYRLSSLKNRQRWNFGILFPPSFSPETESSFMQTECLLEGTAQTAVSAKIQFLQFDGEMAAERELVAGEQTVGALLDQTVHTPFCCSNLTACVEISAASVSTGAFRLSVRISNQTPFAGTDREQALRYALISTQTLLRVRDGAFHSMVEPPEALAAAKNQCRNVGAWPVLVGDKSRRDCMLSAPIILYDYPSIAPQSPADLFDNTEIDEILTLRIQTLSEQEKLEVRYSDARAGRLLDQAESLSAEKFQHLHGTAHRHLRAGDRVRLKPNRRADIFDVALTGKTATICSIEQDFENNTYACVTIDDDPGNDLGVEGKPGHRFFFSLDEVEKMS